MNKSEFIVKLLIALRFAAEEAYKNEVIDTEMYALMIGPGNEFESREAWIQERTDYWLEEAQHSVEATGGDT